MRGMLVTRPSLSLAIALFLLVLPTDGVAQTGALNKDPTDVVKKYLTLDRHGARLEAMSWETVKPYINWKEEPAWGHVVVITDFEVPDDIKQWEIISNLDVVIPVKFRVLGSMYWETAGFLPDAQVEEIRFRVKGGVDRWRIMEPILPPHVGQKRMIGYVRQAMLQETDPSLLTKLTELLDALRKAQ